MKIEIGMKIGRLTLLEEAPSVEDSSGHKRIHYLCLCDCGVQITVKRHSLQNKNGVRSCGCANQEGRSRLGLSKRKHLPHLSSARIIYGNTYADGDLSFDNFIELSKLNCHYCNNEPNNKYNKYLHRQKAKVSDYAKENGLFIYNGLDRIDSSKPHNIDNVVACCKICNMAKSDLTLDEFKQWVNKIYNHWAK